MMIRRSLYWKLALAFMLVAITTAGLVAVFMRVTSTTSLTQLIIDQQRYDLQQSLEEYYTSKGSWDSVAYDWQRLEQKPNTNLNPQNPSTQGKYPLPNDGSGKPPNGDRSRRSFFGLADAKGMVLVSMSQNEPAGTQLSQDILKAGTPISVNGKQVGTILSPQPQQPQPGFNPEENLFLDRTNQALYLAVAVALLVALLMGIFLARTLTQPLRALTLAAQNIAQGDLEQQVKVNSKDEIGRLASAFNTMSQEVAQANLLRRRMTADIAHDLRTPLTVIGGYVESMRDGILKPTTERLSLIYGEIERLQHLVGDLRVLSQADAGELPLNPQHIAPKSLLDRAAALFQHHAERHLVHVRVEAEPELPEIRVDEARLMQVMDNLISNALRYTPENGEIVLGGRRRENRVELTVRDTGSGIAAEELPMVFNRFYRADSSRHSETGESGLGLAIVKAFVEAHGGKVWAESTPGQGTTIFIDLPAAS
jgi:signal transduction histidine kinase